MSTTFGRTTMSETVQSIVKTTVASLNARAITTTVQYGDTAIVVAMNKAAANTLRAFASLIARKAFMAPEIYSVGFDRQFAHRRHHVRRSR